MTLTSLQPYASLKTRRNWSALNEEAEKTLAQAELEDEDFWDSHFSLVRKSSNSNEEVSFLQSNVDPIEVNENETSDVSAVEPPADGVTQQHDLFSETPSPVVALNDQERDFGELTQTSDLVVQATETPTPEVIADAHVPVVETAMNETVSIASDDTDNDGEPIESYTVAVAESFKAGSTTGIRKIPGVRYVRRPDGLKVAREHRWKVRRLYRDRHF